MISVVQDLQVRGVGRDGVDARLAGAGVAVVAGEGTAGDLDADLVSLLEWPIVMTQ